MENHLQLLFRRGGGPAPALPCPGACVIMLVTKLCWECQPWLAPLCEQETRGLGSGTKIGRGGFSSSLLTHRCGIRGGGTWHELFRHNWCLSQAVLASPWAHARTFSLCQGGVKVVTSRCWCIRQWEGKKWGAACGPYCVSPCLRGFSRTLRPGTPLHAEGLKVAWGRAGAPRSLAGGANGGGDGKKVAVNSRSGSQGLKGESSHRGWVG